MPLRIASGLGFVIAFVSGLYGLFLIARHLLEGADLPGYTSLMVVILFLGGVQLGAVLVAGIAVSGQSCVETEPGSILVAGGRDEAATFPIDDIRVPQKCYRSCAGRFQKIGESGNRAVVQVGTAQPKTVERHVGITVGLGEFLESVGRSGEELSGRNDPGDREKEHEEREFERDPEGEEEPGRQAEDFLHRPGRYDPVVVPTVIPILILSGIPAVVPVTCRTVVPVLPIVFAKVPPRVLPVL